MADFSLTRLVASPAAGTVSFARFTPTQAALIPVGAVVRTSDGTQGFAVTASTTNAAFSAAQNGYVVPSGIGSLSVPVAAQSAGSAGNVLAGTITLLASTVPGIDTVANAAPMQGGLDAESDAALRARFQAYVNSRSLATTGAVAYAIGSIQQNLDYAIQENVDPTGAPLMGSFVVTVDDGTGSPSSALLAAAAAAVDAVRPVGSIYTVQPPSVVTANVSLTIAVASGAVKSLIAGPVGIAVASWINTLPIGAALPLSRLAQIAYGVSASIANVSQITINAGTDDLVAGPAQVIKAGSVAIN